MPNMFDLEKANQNISNLIDWIDEQKTLSAQFPVYDPDVDLDEDCNPVLSGCDRVSIARVQDYQDRKKPVPVPMYERSDL